MSHKHFDPYYIAFLAMQEWWVEKALRAAHWYRFKFGHRLCDCGACSGSGYYDNDGSPDCGCCEGSGKEWFKGPKWSLDLFESNCPLLYKILEAYRK